jgi:hypothetical protein
MRFRFNTRSVPLAGGASSLYECKPYLLLEVPDFCLVSPESLCQARPRLLGRSQARPQPFRLGALCAQPRTLRLRMRQPAPQLGGVEIAIAQRLVVTGLQKVDSSELKKTISGTTTRNLSSVYAQVVGIVSLIKCIFYYLKIHYFSLILKRP